MTAEEIEKGLELDIIEDTIFQKSTSYARSMSNNFSRPSSKPTCTLQEIVGKKRYKFSVYCMQSAFTI